MADPLSIPGANISSYNSLVGMMKEVLSSFLQNVDDMLPATVVSYDRATNRAEVQPQIMMIKTDGTIQRRAAIASVPVFQFGGGGFVASFPIQPGDLGWIKASDRDISLFLQSLTQSAPNTYRKHSFEDALFIPDTMMRDVVIDEEDENNLVIQSIDGSVKVSWWSTLLKIIAPRVGVGGTPDPNAILDIHSTTKAFRLPRMTTAQRDAIPNPQEGFMIWNLDTHGVNSYNGSLWS